MQRRQCTRSEKPDHEARGVDPRNSTIFLPFFSNKFLDRFSQLSPEIVEIELDFPRAKCHAQRTASDTISRFPLNSSKKRAWHEG